jgi:hypothetical protein
MLGGSYRNLRRSAEHARGDDRWLIDHMGDATPDQPGRGAGADRRGRVASDFDCDSGDEYASRQSDGDQCSD